tara:strand:+ start:1880 stop:1990 length:111 start_codon:yes stop_codon:yes gene_type:complete
MNEIISFINMVDDFLILIPWIAMYYITWHLDKGTDQ